MKVVLSRKGMDSRAGGIPSPILPDGTLLSLPIPNEKSGVPYGDLVYKGRTYQQIIQQIHPTFDFQKHPFCHLDPDIYGVLKNTHAGWKPAFGQYEIPAKHLDGQGVDVGDVFLFYGMFRQTEKLPDGTLHFVKGAPIQHIIYGYINSVYIKRGMCLNGISPFVQKADLAERVLFFTAKLIKDTSRISDMTFWKDFSADLPYILGGIFDLYSKAMKILPTVKLQKLQRLADFHLFGYAVAEAMKTGLGKEFNEVLEDNKTRQMEITCQNAMIISLVEDFLKNEEDEGYWKGTMSLLYKSLKDFMSQQNMTEEIYNPRTYPKEANHLSRALHQYEAAFASKGIHFQSKKNSKGNMEIEITTDWLKDDIGTIKRVPIITSKT